MRVALTGPPGSGRETVAALLADRLGGPVLTWGDIIRAEVRAGTAAARTALDRMHAGHLVPAPVLDHYRACCAGWTRLCPRPRSSGQ